MSMIHIDKNPPASVMRWFGLVGAAFFVFVGLVTKFRFGAEQLPPVLFGVAAVWATIYYALPFSRRPLYLGWMYATAPLGWIILNTILLVVYYGVLTPLGLALRASGYDPLQRRASNAKSFWARHAGNKPVERYFRQY